MQFVVHGHHLDLTDSLKERCRSHVLDRVEKLVDDSAAKLEIVLSDRYGTRHGKADKTCSLDLRAPGVTRIHVTEVRASMHEAIDLAADRLIEALRRGVERGENFNRRETLRNVVAPNLGGPEEARALSSEF